MIFQGLVESNWRYHLPKLQPRPQIGTKVTDEWNLLTSVLDDLGHRPVQSMVGLQTWKKNMLFVFAGPLCWAKFLKIFRSEVKDIAIESYKASVWDKTPKIEKTIKNWIWPLAFWNIGNRCIFIIYRWHLVISSILVTRQTLLRFHVIRLQYGEFSPFSRFWNIVQNRYIIVRDSNLTM